MRIKLRLIEGLCTEA